LAMHGHELLEKVAARRVEMILEEVKDHYPGSEVEVLFHVDGRVHLTLFWNGAVIGQEYVETAASWNDPERMKEYRKVLINNKVRLVVLVPERHARAARLKMLDLNHRWLFYYLVFGYDHEGEIKRIGRPTYCHPDAGYS
jgi:hypothetical protein